MLWKWFWHWQDLLQPKLAHHSIGVMMLDYPEMYQWHTDAEKISILVNSQWQIGKLSVVWLPIYHTLP